MKISRRSLIYRIAFIFDGELTSINTQAVSLCRLFWKFIIGLLVGCPVLISYYTCSYIYAFLHWKKCRWEGTFLDGSLLISSERKEGLTFGRFSFTPLGIFIGILLILILSTDFKVFAYFAGISVLIIGLFYSITHFGELGRYVSNTKVGKFIELVFFGIKNRICPIIYVEE